MSKNYKTELLTQHLPHTSFAGANEVLPDIIQFCIRNIQGLELGRVKLKMENDNIEIMIVDLANAPEINLHKSGIGKKIISNIIDFAEHTKINKLTLKAGGIGSYFAAKLAIPDRPEQVNKEVLIRLKESNIQADEKAALETILQNGGPNALRCVANSVHGKPLLLNLTTYAATIDLSKDKALLREYTKLSHSQVLNIKQLLQKSYETEVVF